MGYDWFDLLPDGVSLHKDERHGGGWFVSDEWDCGGGIHPTPHQAISEYMLCPRSVTDDYGTGAYTLLDGEIVYRYASQREALAAAGYKPTGDLITDFSNQTHILAQALQKRLKSIEF